MNNLKDFTQYITEMKSERELVRDLARHLSVDKDIIKYLNTSRSKRTIGWRELLRTKLHGHNLDYINYITKNMVADYNPQITGYIHIDDGDGRYEDDVEDTRRVGRFKGMSVEDEIEDIENRVEDIEDVLGIDPDESETLYRAADKLGLNPDFAKDREEGEEIEEEPEEE